MTEEKATLRDRLFQIREATYYLQKDAQGHGYKYVKGSTVLAQIVSLMNKLGVMMKPRVVLGTMKVTAVEKHTAKGTKTEYVVQADIVVRFECKDDSTDFEDNPWAVVASSDNAAWAWGGALTYNCDRYFPLKYFNVPTDEDDPDRFIAEKGTPEMKKQRDDSRDKTDAQLALEMTSAIANCMDLPALLTWWQDNMKAIKLLVPKFKKQIEEVKDARKKELSEAPPNE